MNVETTYPKDAAVGKGQPAVPNKALFIGNSLLLGMGSYGMCASAPDKDWYAQVTSAILKRNPSARFDRLHIGKAEQADCPQDMLDWLAENRSRFLPELDLIVMQIGDNVNTPQRKAAWDAGLEPLLKSIAAQCPRARIVLMAGWYNYELCGPALKACAAQLGLEMVDIRDLHTKEAEGFLGQTYVLPDGTLAPVKDNWVSHPGDAGMAAIARRLIEVLGL